MTSDLHQRRRPPTDEELGNIPWLPLLLPKERERAINALRVGDAEKGDFVSGKIISFRQEGEGRPVLDSSQMAARIIKEASEHDFPSGQIRIDLNGNLSLSTFR